ncbi:MAG: Vitamin B12 import ATP-binding protein BtuD [Acidimicrobiales bacterium]|nr:MAG: ABC transporter ATP-binding protein [Actinomycetota bacterium]MBV6508529.1 Vitamin B12 import ATP-binding protein BtuD [Acidimicrobiales bacterium]RIK05155.1 MAG: ABC transporter ATP-binding protein [Acidobacteriota bacterium]
MLNISLEDQAREGKRDEASTSAIDVGALEKSFGAQRVLRGVDLRVDPGSIVALLGPSGCGKTTLLRSIAGLETADAGAIAIGGEPVTGPDLHVAPERRRVGMVFQDWALFPHMSVARNVAYGIGKGADTDVRVAGALEMVGLAGMGDRMPGTLSGGQQQRVAIARALAPEPAVLLLDEPFSNLDTNLRVQVRSEVHRLLTSLGVTAVFVTHDQEEAFVLGDEVAVMNRGLIVQQATPSELYLRPASPWIARFVGDANLLPAQASDGHLETPIGMLASGGSYTGAVEVAVRPEDVELEPGNRGVVELVEYYGHDTVYLVSLDGGVSIHVRATSAPAFKRGDRVGTRFIGDSPVVFDPEHIRGD